jgi:hypothetical protein
MQAQKKNESNHRRSYIPKPETVALLKVSGNPINGLGETAARKASPFFWDPPDQHPYGELQVAARQSSRRCPGAAPAFMAAYNHPELIPIAGEQIKAAAEQHAAETTNSYSRMKPTQSASRPWTRSTFLRDIRSRSPGSSFSPWRTTTIGSNRLLPMRPTAPE